MWNSNTATAMMMFPIVTAIVHQLAARTEDPEAAQLILGRVMMLGLAYSASIGGVATLIGTPPNVVLAGAFETLYSGNSGAPTIGFAQWMAFGVPFTLIMLPIAWLLILRLVGGARLSALDTGDASLGLIRDELSAMGPMSSAEGRVLVVFVLTALGLVFRAPIQLGFATVPGWSGLLADPGFATDATVTMATGLSLFLLPAGPRAAGRLVELRDARLHSWGTFEAGAPWGILLLFGGGFALAKGFVATGLAAGIGDAFQVFGVLPVPLVVLMVCLLMTFLTEVTSNTATATTMMPILGAVAVSMGVHPLLLMVPASVSASCAFMLPVATPPNAIVFGSRWVSVPDMVRAGVALNVVGALVVTVLMLTLGSAVFGIEWGVLPDWAQ